MKEWSAAAIPKMDASMTADDAALTTMLKASTAWSIVCCVSIPTVKGLLQLRNAYYITGGVSLRIPPVALLAEV